MTRTTLVVSSSFRSYHVFCRSVTGSEPYYREDVCRQLLRFTRSTLETAGFEGGEISFYSANHQIIIETRPDDIEEDNRQAGNGLAPLTRSAAHLKTISKKAIKHDRQYAYPQDECKDQSLNDDRPLLDLNRTPKIAIRRNGRAGSNGQ